MKNKNNLVLTTGIIAVFLIAITLGSGLFTGFMGNTEETDNNLTADTQQTENSEEMEFDYPYYDFSKLRSYTDEYAQYYTDTMRVVMVDTDDGMTDAMTYMEKQNYSPTEEMLSFQQVANIFGNAVKYLYGYTAHTIKPIVVAYGEKQSYNTNTKEYTKRYVVDYTDKDITDKFIDFYAVIEPLTGKFITFKANDYINIDKNFSGKEIAEIAVTDENIYNMIKDAVVSALKNLGYNETADTIVIDDMNRSVKWGVDGYRTNITLSTGQKCMVKLITVNNEYFEMNEFVLF